MTRKIYQRPHIKEVVCEIRCDGNELNDNIFHDFFSNIEENFSKIETIRNINIHVGPMPPPPLSRPSKRIISKDQKSLTLVGSGFFALSFLNYKQWEHFFEQIQWVGKRYFKSIDAKNFFRIGLRYINHFYFTEEQSRSLDNFFNFSLGVPKSLNNIAAFSVGIVNTFEQTVINVKLGNGKEHPNGGRPIIILDMDHYTKPGVTLALGGLYKFINDVHEKTHDVFEELITEKMRKEILGGYQLI